MLQFATISSTNTIIQLIKISINLLHNYGKLKRTYSWTNTLNDFNYALAK